MNSLLAAPMIAMLVSSTSPGAPRMSWDSGVDAQARFASTTAPADAMARDQASPMVSSGDASDAAPQPAAQTRDAPQGASTLQGDLDAGGGAAPMVGVAGKDDASAASPMMVGPDFGAEANKLLKGVDATTAQALILLWR